MNDLDYVLMTNSDPDLAASISSNFPAVRVKQIGPDPFTGRIDGNIWCFVDWTLSEISGLEMCRRLRAFPATANSHITIALDEDEPEMRRRALKAGADDYLVGPLTADTLIARLKDYQSTKASTSFGALLSNGPLTVDLVARLVSWNAKPFDLQPNQFQLLVHFMEHPNQVLTRPSLIAMLAKDGQGIDERTVDVWIGRLRRAVMAQGAPDPLRTVRGYGYVFDKPGLVG
jgi:two-component system, OmpR family, phosphate regulon response regulator PhoB